jgi:hypothetical protein
VDVLEVMAEFGSTARMGPLQCNASLTDIAAILGPPWDIGRAARAVAGHGRLGGHIRKNPPVTDELFWNLITAAAPTTDDGRVLVARLVTLPDADLRDFEVILNRLLRDAYRWDLWGAAYLINGGCSDDGFEYFRCWLIAQGRATYAEALRDPDTLADHPAVREDEDCDCELLLYAAGEAYENRTGNDRDRFYDSLDPQARRLCALLVDEAWRHEDNAEITRRFPRLAALLLDDE